MCDAHALPRVDNALHCLNGAVSFTSLDLKLGYWQVEMDGPSKPLTAFTVSPLRLYECNRMLFKLVDAPATFKRLMQSSLGNVHLQWCIIYLYDITAFAKTPKEHLKQL